MTSKADLKRYDKLVRHGCVCCKALGFYSVPEIHHIVDKGYRKHSGGNQATLPLCPTHHRGAPAGTNEVTGPALSDGSKVFEACWGTQRQLLDKVNRELK